MEEESYFFKLSRFREPLIEHFQQNPSFVKPDAQRNFILKRLQDDPLLDLSISRNKLKWGIPLPIDESHVMYVWFDALTNYLSGIDYPDGENSKYWPSNVQLIGKDIVWFHTVIYPAMLLSAGIPLPKTVFAHGFVNDAEGKKMSKTTGNVIDPHPVLDKYPADSFRVFLMHNITFGNDLPFSETNLVMVHNADLADSLGNLINRVTNVTSRYFKSITPDAVSDQIFDVETLRSESESKFKLLDLGGAYSLAISACKEINNYLTTKEPWKIKDDPDNAKKAVIIRSILEAIYVVGHFLSPFIPLTACKIFEALNTDPIAISKLAVNGTNLTVGTQIGTKFAFQKFPIPGQEAEEEKKDDKSKGKPAPKKKKQQQKPPADQPLFSKLDLRVGEITKVWKHPNSNKLWCEEIDVGADQPLQVCSGLQDFYTEEQMNVCLFNSSIRY